MYGTRRADQGALAERYVLVGMTRERENPEYRRRRREYVALTDDLRRFETFRTRADSWIAEYNASPVLGFYAHEKPRDELAAVEQAIREQLVTGPYVFAPDGVLDARNERTRRRLVAALNAGRPAPDADPGGDSEIVALEDAIVEATALRRVGVEAGAPSTPALENARVAARNDVTALAIGVLREFSRAIGRTDWSVAAVTRQELRARFEAAAADVLARRRGTASALPLEYTDAKDAADAERLYNAELVRVMTVEPMLAWFADAFPLADAAVPADERARRADVLADLTDAVYGSVATRAATVGAPAPLEPVRVRGAVLRSDTQRERAFLDAVLASIRLDAEIAGLGKGGATTLTDAKRAELAERAAATRASVDASEAALQVRRIRLLDAAYASQADAATRVAQARAALAKLPRTVRAPLVVERAREATAAPLVFEVALVERAAYTGLGAEATALENTLSPARASRALTYTLFYERPPDALDALGVPPTIVTSRALAANGTSRVRFEAAIDASPTTTERRGFYYVRANVADLAAVDDVDAGSELFSRPAHVRVIAACRRCAQRTQFDVAAERPFGECAWRAHPESPEALRERESAPFTATAESLGLALERGDFIAALDDSVRVPGTDAAVRDDGSLLALGRMPRADVRARYFTYSAVLRSLDARRRAAGERLDLAGPAYLAARLEQLEATGALLADELDAAAAAVDSRLVREQGPASVLGAARLRPRFADIVAATAAAQTLDAVPLAAALAVVSLGAPPLVYESERRFFGALEADFVRFASLYRHAQLFFARSTAVTPALALLSAAGVRSSSAWTRRALRDVYSYTDDESAASMFTDGEGERRLYERIERAQARYSAQTRAECPSDSTYVGTCRPQTPGSPAAQIRKRARAPQAPPRLLRRRERAARRAARALAAWRPRAVHGRRRGARAVAH